MDFDMFGSRRLKATPQDKASMGLCEHTAKMVVDLMNAATSFHKLHLTVTGAGSYAAHKALNELYDALPEHADTLAEGYQGAREKILTYPDATPVPLTSVEEGLDLIRSMYAQVNELQAMMPFSEIVNELDEVKSTLNSIKYKLLFLS